MHLILFLAVLFVQFQATQTLSFLCFIVATTISILNLIFKNKSIKVIPILNLVIWLFFMMLMIRSNYIGDTETHISILWLSIGAMAFIIIATNEHLNRNSILNTTVVAGVIGAAVNLLSYITGWIIPFLIAPPYAGTRWMGGFDGPNELSAFYVMILAIILGMYLQKEYTLFKFLILFSIVVPLTYLGYSRGALLGLIGLIIVFIVYSYILSKRWVLLTVIYTSILWITYRLFFKELINDFYQIRRGQTERSELFSESLELLLESPIFGHGLGAFGDLSNVINNVPHSDYLLVMVSGGVIGLSILLGFYALFLRKAYTSKFYPELLVLLVYFSQALTFNHIVRGRLSILFWIVVMLIYLGRENQIISKTQLKTHLNTIRLIRYKV